MVTRSKVMQFFKDKFAITKSKSAIYYHMPATVSEDALLDKSSRPSMYRQELYATTLL